MNWQERLNEHEETAPQDTWEEIRQSLELDRSGLREKLLALESEPPAAAWSGIRESLELRSTPVPRLAPFFRRHAATAGIAASLLLVVSVYLGSSDDIISSTASVASSVRPATSQATPSSPLNQHIDATNAPRPDIATGTAEDKPNPAWSSNNTKPQPTASIRPTNERTTQNRTSRGSNYIEICDEKGECDRLTYKLESWAPCLHASCSDAEVMGAERARRIDEWRAKLEQSTYIPAAGHFFDIGEMARFLQTEEY